MTIKIIVKKFVKVLKNLSMCEEIFPSVKKFVQGCGKNFLYFVSDKIYFVQTKNILSQTKMIDGQGIKTIFAPEQLLSKIL